MGLKQIIHVHLVLRPRKSGAIPSVPVGFRGLHRKKFTLTLYLWVNIHAVRNEILCAISFQNVGLVPENTRSVTTINWCVAAEMGILSSVRISGPFRRSITRIWWGQLRNFKPVLPSYPPIFLSPISSRHSPPSTFTTFLCAVCSFVMPQIHHKLVSHKERTWRNVLQS
jgi:hypothetical protein